jgi:hypothetical protein
MALPYESTAEAGGPWLDSSDPSPLDMLKSAQTTLAAKTFSKDCLDFLGGLGTSDTGQDATQASISKVLAALTFVDGTQSSDLFSGLWKNLPDLYGSAKEKYGTTTVQQQFSLDNPVAATVYGGSTVYYNPNRITGASSDDMLVTLMHEAMHSLGFMHSDMADAAANTGSSFDAGLRTKCIH